MGIGRVWKYLRRRAGRRRVATVPEGDGEKRREIGISSCTWRHLPRMSPFASTKDATWYKNPYSSLKSFSALKSLSCSCKRVPVIPFLSENAIQTRSLTNPSFILLRLNLVGFSLQLFFCTHHSRIFYFACFSSIKVSHVQGSPYQSFVPTSYPSKRTGTAPRTLWRRSSRLWWRRSRRGRRHVLIRSSFTWARTTRRPIKPAIPIDRESAIWPIRPWTSNCTVAQPDSLDLDLYQLVASCCGAAPPVFKFGWRFKWSCCCPTGGATGPCPDSTNRRHFFYPCSTFLQHSYGWTWFTWLWNPTS